MGLSDEWEAVPPKNRINLPPLVAERWRNICWKSKTGSRNASLNDADRVLITHLEEIVDGLLELGSACMDVAVRFQYLDLPEAVRPEVMRVFDASKKFGAAREALEHIEVDLKLSKERSG